MNSQEHIFKMLAVEGECLHEKALDAPVTHSFDKDSPHGTCALCHKKISFTNDILPDLTTPDGAFWLLKRLPEWGRFEEFCAWWPGYVKAWNMHGINICKTIKWLATDAKDGKAPVLYEALCEFEGLEVGG